jgi:hypothetical protein
VKTVKPSQLELDQPPKTRERLIQDTMPHIDTNGAAYQGDMGKVDAIALEARAREALELDDEFNWNTDDSIILKEQRATAVYFNRLGELIIRQKAAWSDDEDSIVYVMPENFNGLLDGIAARIRQGGGTQ